VHWLDPKPGEVWVDATLGAGGHTRLIAERVAPTGRVLALDQDPTAVADAQAWQTDYAVRAFVANFDNLVAVLEEQQLQQVNGLFADLGFSSDQVDDPARGLSFRHDGPLDMRLNASDGPTAADLVNSLPEDELANLIYEYGEERKSRWVAKKIVERRKAKRYETTGDLADTVRRCVPRSGNIDPATRTFQALRIAVNDELGALDRLLAVLPHCIAHGGRVGIISFHSLEDRRVKQAFRQQQYWTVLTKKPIEATASEAAQNPRARSAKLRVALRTTNDEHAT
jgi:16S rRNA (cytosine1402-N4)-methyltransferase